MVLDPLTQVRIRMLVPVTIGSGQFMVHILSNCKGSKRKQQ